MRMNREQRKALMRQELEGGDVDVQQVDSVDVRPEPVADSPSLVAGVDPNLIAQIAAAVAVAMQQQGAQSADVIAQALRDNRKPIPENTDAEYHGRSHYHPEGKDTPRPELARETWRGSWNHEERKANPREKFDPSQLRDDEIETINALTPGDYEIERLDGVKTMFHVVDQDDAQGKPFRRILAFPAQMYQKEHKNAVPDLKSIRRQLLTVA